MGEIPISPAAIGANTGTVTAAIDARACIASVADRDMVTLCLSMQAELAAGQWGFGRTVMTDQSGGHNGHR